MRILFIVTSIVSVIVITLLVVINVVYNKEPVENTISESITPTRDTNLDTNIPKTISNTDTDTDNITNEIQSNTNNITFKCNGTFYINKVIVYSNNENINKVTFNCNNDVNSTFHLNTKKTIEIKEFINKSGFSSIHIQKNKNDFLKLIVDNETSKISCPKMFRINGIDINKSNVKLICSK
jgi:desulfoferrodoxin (superoxide reductase-like protein)